MLHGNLQHPFKALLEIGQSHASVLHEINESSPAIIEKIAGYLTLVFIQSLVVCLWRTDDIKNTFPADGE